MISCHYDIVQCPACGSVQVSPLPSEDEIAGLYPVGYNFKIESSDRGISRAIKMFEWRVFYRSSFQRNYRMLRRAVGRDGFSILDVGCGSGLRLQVFKDAGCEVEGNETSAACVEHIHSIGGIPVHHGRIETLNISRQYDVVTMFALLEHLADPLSVVSAVKKLLKPGGKLVIQVPVVDSIQFKLLGRRSAMVSDMPRHVFIPSLSGLRAFMVREGFAQHSCCPVSLFERATLFALGIMPLSSTPVTYGRSPTVRTLYRVLGWGLTVFPGLLVALMESFTRAGAETVFVFEIKKEV